MHRQCSHNNPICSLFESYILLNPNHSEAITDSHFLFFRSVVQFSAAVILAGQVVFIFGTKGIKKNIGLLWIPLMIFFYVRNNPNIKFYSLTYTQVLLLFVCCILFSALGGFNDRCWMIKMVSSWRYLYFIYIAFTIYMFLDSSAINFVCNLFPDAASTILNQYHNAGIPGLTKHYSTNGMLLAVGTMIFGSYALTEKRRSENKMIQLIALCITAIYAVLTNVDMLKSGMKLVKSRFGK